MTRDVVRVSEDTPLARVAALLDLKKIKRVPVMRHGKTVGIVSRADLLRALVRAAAPRASIVSRADLLRALVRAAAPRASIGSAARGRDDD